MYGSEDRRKWQMASTTPTIELRSPAFGDRSRIPAQYTCDGGDFSPPLSWSQPPAGTRSQALIVDDPDAPSGVFTHWLLFNIPPDRTTLQEDVSRADSVPGVGEQGTNDFGRPGYGGPCPPGGRPHRYVFTIYALDSTLGQGRGRTKGELLRQMSGRVLAKGQLVGLYQRR